MIQRMNIRGGFNTGHVFKTKCYECGMPTLAADEFHPYEACEIFKRTHDSRAVEKALPLLAEDHQLVKP